MRLHLKSFGSAIGCLLISFNLLSQGITLQDIVRETKPLPSVTVYTAKEIVTLDSEKPKATAVAVVGDRILAVGSLEELTAAAGEQPYTVDNTFADKVIVPGLIAQHDHPLLSSLAMMSEIIAIEDWVLPNKTVPAANNQDEYRQRLIEANKRLKTKDELLFTWGYHPSFHGPLVRTDLDKISTTRPIIVWHRSCHEFTLNTVALKTLGIDEAFVDKFSKTAKEQSDLSKGHFWEQGMFGIVPKIVPFLATPERLQKGLELTQEFYHTNGVTLACEPGGLYSQKLQEAENAVLSKSSSPFRFYFIPDGKSIYSLYPENAIVETEKTLDWCHGMTNMLPNQVKLFADGAIYSLAIQLRDPYINGDFKGEWIMDPELFARAFQVYWDAGYQIHIHVNGDAGLDMLLNNLEANMRRNPRYDHRMVVVHFAVSGTDQVKRIKRLGAIVSGNPYYVTALADMYSKDGLGPERADNMVRMGDVEKANIPFSYHSDMPMAPGQPLFLMDCGVNRITKSGRVAGKEQRVSREGALKAVTIEAAYSLGLEKEVGSIEAGKLANFTILADNPITCKASEIKDIPIWGTMHEGRLLPINHDNSVSGSIGPVLNENTYLSMQEMETDHCHNDEHNHNNCVCTLNRIFSHALAEQLER
ncbi:amidohydrolase [Carboxylicivirga mesophila]|uniref:Amidohydrolase n=1 Tax=Carboxylicivirga mesophila TaxID=1166478 RepID=A0ABS5KBW8_9BACT|nr:amidohydrolase [Carboxylicivirga mesophila]MBS2211988.1 amidohydrolase [Carboxylicivirga mesophila]